MAEQKKKKPVGKDGKPAFNFYWIYAIIAVILIAFTLADWGESSKQITKKEFVEEILKKEGAEKIVVMDKEMVLIYLNETGLKSKFFEDHKPKKSNSVLGADKSKGPQYYFNILSIDNFDLTKEKWVEDYDLKVSSEKTGTTGAEIFIGIFPILLIVLFMVVIMRRMSGGAGGGSQIFSIGKSKAKMFGKGKSTNTTFADVAGLEGAKEEIVEIVDFLKTPKKYTELGAKIPKGALLIGPPGTGKTLLAKAVAGEAKVPFFSLSGSDFVEMFVGVGASRVRDLFKQAKEKAPCIIFIDEIDAIGKARGRNANMSSNDEHENTLNQLLTEMDGFGTNSGVIILAATNRADVLDPALLRAGRFDRQINVDMPNVNERKEIFVVHLKPLKKGNDIDKDFLAKQTPGFSGADIANLCNEAALIAARKSKKSVEKQDFLDAIDRIVGGLEKKNNIIKPIEKKTIAFHEAGHATISWMCEHANPLIKVTIVPRGKSLGAAWYLPEERQITTTEQILDEMCSALGGRAAEQIIFNKISTGALSDLEKVTKQAQAMVTIYGFNDKIGNVSYYDPQNNYNFKKPYSEATAQMIDEEIKKIIDIQYQRAITILTENKENLTKLAELLLEKEVIFKDDLENIFGKRPFDDEETPFVEIKTDAEEKEATDTKEETTVEEVKTETKEEVKSETDTTTTEESTDTNESN